MSLSCGFLLRFMATVNSSDLDLDVCHFINMPHLCMEFFFLQHATNFVRRFKVSGTRSVREVASVCAADLRPGARCGEIVRVHPFGLCPRR
mmetsp:Transcript_43909/g.116021  ORF Transcript_43909/g.116021 Transcript_43909/m.116021 type:complete len:91 (+) Transcript_43909:701-973(+)